MRSNETFCSHKMLPLNRRQNLIETLGGFHFKNTTSVGDFKMPLSELIDLGWNETKHNNNRKNRQDLPHAITINNLRQQFKLIHKYKTYTPTNRKRCSFLSSDQPERMSFGGLYFSRWCSAPFWRDRVLWPLSPGISRTDLKCFLTVSFARPHQP